ncbi:hypothetical protein [Pseudarthrobacter chlorophenolicus]|nr:hypothetical protein [Pseudarthrobacter chlorophenolicus]
MTDYVNTQPAGTRTYRAFISVIDDSVRRRTVVMVNPDSLPLPLSDVDVAVGPEELFITTSGNGETWYFQDLGDAWWFTKNSGCVGTPDAIQILSPLEKHGIKVWKVIPVHQRAVSVNR